MIFLSIHKHVANVGKEKKKRFIVRIFFKNNPQSLIE